MEDRSFRRLRTLVTQMAQSRGDPIGTFQKKLPTLHARVRVFFCIEVCWSLRP